MYGFGYTMIDGKCIIMGGCDGPSYLNTIISLDFKLGTVHYFEEVLYCVDFFQKIICTVL